MLLVTQQRLSNTAPEIIKNDITVMIAARGLNLDR
jgi:hypothetical protein